MTSIAEINADALQGNFRKLARALTLVENELPGASELLLSLTHPPVPVIGITGPPGAGKSTLTNALINKLSSDGKRIAVVAVDPTSPFNFGSLLGDRIRMSEHFNKPGVFIRSLATRGSLGGLSGKAIEITDVIKAAGFDYVIVETVGVGQSEVEIAGLADVSVVVLVPESGDEIQNIKSGLMEIADVFVVNKSDRDGAILFANNLEKILKQNPRAVSVIKTIATKSEGIDDLITAINQFDVSQNKKRRNFLLIEKAWKLIRDQRMKSVDKQQIVREISRLAESSDFNLYHYASKFYNTSSNS